LCYFVQDGTDIPPPPFDFFTSMVHLVVHNADLGDPYNIGRCIWERGKSFVCIFINLISRYYKTMTNYCGFIMHICRSLGLFKSSVRNKATLEGYIAIELVTLCSRYLDNALAFHDRTQRNLDASKGVGRRVILNRITLT
jgi:hypothetical protein